MSIRKDIHKDFKFPEPFPLEKKLKDLLEPVVDEKYYLSQKMVDGMKTSKTNEVCDRAIGGGLVKPNDVIEPTYANARLEEIAQGKIRKQNVRDNQVCPTLRCNPDKLGITVVGRLDIKGHDLIKRVYDSGGISPTVTTMGGGNCQPKIIDAVACASRGRNPENPSDRTIGAPTEQRLEFRKDEVTNTLTTVQKDNYVAIKQATKNLKQQLCDSLIENGKVQDGDVISHNFTSHREDDGKAVKGHNETPTLDTRCDCLGVATDTPLRIRKLTPKECWRLMGFDDEDFEKAEKVNSNAQLYKQAGNSIVVNVLQEIFKELLK